MKHSGSRHRHPWIAEANANLLSHSQTYPAKGLVPDCHTYLGITMELGCGLGMKTVHGRRYLRFWRHERRNGGSVKIER